MGGLYRELARHYAALFPLKEAQRLFLDRLLANHPAGRVLDVGCAVGTHLEYVLSRGHRAWGIEPDESMLAMLRARSWPGPAPTIVDGGAERLPELAGELFDLVLCLGNTLSHLPDAPAACRAVREMADRLSTGGTLAVQTVNWDGILARRRWEPPLLTAVAEEGGTVTLRRGYDLAGLPGRVAFTLELTADGSTSRETGSLTVLPAADLSGWMAEAGLVDMESLGDWDGRHFDPAAPAHVCTARKIVLPDTSAPRNSGT